MADSTVTVADLRTRVAAFVEARDWERFHNPKDLAIALDVEAAELLERFLWVPEAGSEALSEADRAAVGEELSDVLIYGLSLANALRLDVSDAVLAKLAKDEAKYPADRVRGRARAPERGDPP